MQPEIPFSRALPPIALALMSALVGVSRGGVRVVVENRLLARLPEGVRVLLIGCGAGGPRLAHGLNSNPRLGYSVVGYLTEDGLPRQEMPERLPLLGGIGDLEHCLDEHAVDEVVVAELPQDRSILAGVIMLCERNMVLFKMVPDLFDIPTSSVEITGVDVPLIGLPENSLIGLEPPAEARGRPRDRQHAPDPDGTAFDPCRVLDSAGFEGADLL